MTKTNIETYHADNGGLRADQGKTEFHLLPLDGLTELGKVYTFGAKKYAPRNWERGMLWSRCYNSLLRHLYAYWSGERNDQETGLHHMAHVAWNAIALLVYSLRTIGIDDRFIQQDSQLQVAMQNSEAAGSNFSPIKDGKLTSEVTDLMRHDMPPITPVAGMKFLTENGSKWEVKVLFVSEHGKFLAESPDGKSQMMTARAIKTIIPSSHRCMHCPNDAELGSVCCSECNSSAARNAS